MKILLVGGGTGGSVSPLLAVAKEIKKQHPKAQFLFVGTKNGPEFDMVSAEQIPFTSVSAGKFRRYFSILNVLTPFLVLAGLLQSISAELQKWCKNI